MSWLARSLANSLMSDHRDGNDGEAGGDPATKSGASENKQIEAEEFPTRGVKEDLSELTQTLTRQFWGVASFLAPPPSSPTDSGDRRPHPDASGDRRPHPDASGDEEEAEASRIAGIRSDIAEIGGRFRTGIFRLSNNPAVSEISKIASTFLPFGSEEEEDESEEKYAAGAVGVTDEVLSFARNISMHPETWLDFPLFHEFEDCDDFDMSDTQQEHALSVEYLAPRLGALRIELCPSHMSEGCFWKIYFVLLHSRLNKHDAELLSTSQIVEARAMLQRLQSRKKLELERPTNEQFTSSSTLAYETVSTKPMDIEESIADSESEKHPIATTTMEVKMIDKSVIGEELPSTHFVSKGIIPGDPASSRTAVPCADYQDDDGEDDWLVEEETGEIITSIPIVNDEDVSFSDLEDEDINPRHKSKSAF